MKNLWPILILGGLMVVMMVATIIPQKKRQKKAQAMMKALKAGDKIKTIGGFIGSIFAVDESTNTFIINIGANGVDVFVTIDKNAIYTAVNDNPAKNAANATAPEKKEEAFVEAEVTTADDAAAEKRAEEAKMKKAAKKEAKAVEVEVEKVEDASASTKE